MTKKRVLLIVPAFNEEQNIEKTIGQIKAYQPRDDYTLDYIVIDDGSTDGTGEICRRKGYPCVHLVQNLGIGGAVQTGYLYAVRHQYDAAVQFDGDGQHDIQSLDAILRPVLEGETDLCVGSRFLDNVAIYAMTFAFGRYSIGLMPARCLLPGFGAALLCNEILRRRKRKGSPMR